MRKGLGPERRFLLSAGMHRAKASVSLSAAKQGKRLTEAQLAGGVRKTHRSNIKNLRTQHGGDKAAARAVYKRHLVSYGKQGISGPSKSKPPKILKAKPLKQKKPVAGRLESLTGMAAGVGYTLLPYKAKLILGKVRSTVNNVKKHTNKGS